MDTTTPIDESFGGSNSSVPPLKKQKITTTTTTTTPTTPTNTPTTTDNDASSSVSSISSSTNIMKYGGKVTSSFLSIQQKQELEIIASKLATYGKGITACDESSTTIGTRFNAVGLKDNTIELRRQYRQLLFETLTIEQYLCGAILDPETLDQVNDNGVKFPKVLSQRGIVCGVKPHLKVYTLPGTNGDTVMQGLDSLAVRCQNYYNKGVRFTKWRSPFEINIPFQRPSQLAIESNMNDLARYALICQSIGLVPIIEPDISIKGKHTLDDSISINIQIQSILFQCLRNHNVYLPGTIVKTNMVLPGKDCPIKYSIEDIAIANVFVLEQCVPIAIKSINYLSGGQSFSQVVARLSAINQYQKQKQKQQNTNGGNGGGWNLSFSWSQAIQLPLLNLCKKEKNSTTTTSSSPLSLLPNSYAMMELYQQELKHASDAAKGTYIWNVGDGDHIPPS